MTLFASTHATSTPTTSTHNPYYDDDCENSRTTEILQEINFY